MTATLARATAALLALACIPSLAQADPVDVACAQTAQSLVGMAGDAFEVVCPADCAEGRVWGTAIYSDDSSICRAAIHAGAVDAATGGPVTVTLHEGQASYPASEANGVQSEVWGPWQRSFVVSGPAAEGTGAAPGQ